MDPCIVDDSVEIPTRCSFIIEFIIPSINFEIINSITKLHFVGISTESCYSEYYHHTIRPKRRSGLQGFQLKIMVLEKRDLQRFQSKIMFLGNKYITPLLRVLGHVARTKFRRACPLIVRI